MSGDSLTGYIAIEGGTMNKHFVITADWHLREDMPVSRNDPDWLETQQNAINYVMNYADMHDADVCVDGDIFHRSHVHPSLVSIFLNSTMNYRKHVYIMPGQHDLPHHNMDYAPRSSFGNIWGIANQRRTSLLPVSDLGYFIPFGTLEDKIYEDVHTDFVFIHQLTFASKKDMPPTDEAILASELCERFPYARFICLGDNHHHFLYTPNDIQQVINPGCFLRQSAELINYKAGFYHIHIFGSGVADVDINFIEIPDQGSVSNDHLTKEKERDDRIEAFVSSLEKDSSLSLDFVENLRGQMPSVKPDVKAVVEDLISDMEGGNI